MMSCQRRMVTFCGLAALLCTGCNMGEQLRGVEREMSDLKLEVFKLRQQAEEATKKADQEYQANQEARNLDRRFQADLQESLRQLQDSTRILNNRVGDSSRSNGGSRGPSTTRPVTPAVSPGSDEDKTFGAAILDYNRGNYAIAAEGLSLFITSHPTSSKRADALFYLGLSQWHQKLYDKAQGTFDKILKEHASSNQFLPAKLKRSQCLLKMGLKPAAIKAFKEITDGFPGTPEARTAQQELADMGM